MAAIIPARLQLSRRKGFNLQQHSHAVNGLDAVNVSRPSKLGNRYVVKHSITPGSRIGRRQNYIAVPSAFTAVSRFRADWEAAAANTRALLDELRGKNAACWCELCVKHEKTGKPLGITCTECARCHADVLLELANG